MTRGTRAPTLAIGPANFAGQAFEWARAVEATLRVEARAFSHRPMPLRRAPFAFPVDRRLPYARLTTRGMRRVLARRLLTGVSHLAVDGFLPILGQPGRDSLGTELAQLRGEVESLALIAHGGDVRDPQRHIERLSFSYFRDSPGPWVELLRRTAAANRRTAEDFDGPVFVSTPDLLLDVPKATWLPLTIQCHHWRSDEPMLVRERPVFVHIPSRRKPPIKGSDIIDPVLRALHERGRIEYVSATAVSHDRMVEIVKQSDVVVDQILTGSYGAAAVEAMAAGKLVVGNVAADVRALMPEDPPIVDAPPDAFEAVIERILAERAHFAGRGVAGAAFVERWHNGVAAAKTLSAFLGT